ncbi:trafficking protein particle complex subunit 14 isoform X2 [Phyllopteryx taeniolatus]|uniref:trafficking protein particle complex subunit 14 isoform X2 n=1 Tax=Phyllopteryx taeniolatus TaxID=161469 RepID=UPI002AD56980|nr:trafficking protein particle complex subunit 14 isoform X2 [Phyllopteryx taeniolatus]
MESPLFGHTVYFPVAGEAADPAKCDTLPQRTHFYLGERVYFLLVLRQGSLLRAKQMDDLFAVATVGAQLDANESVEEEGEAEEDRRRRSGRAEHRKFVECCPLLGHSNARHRMEPVKSTPLSEEQVSFRLTVCLDELPVNTVRAEIVVSVWERDEDLAVSSPHGCLGLLQLRSPARAFGDHLNKFKAQVGATLNVLPPPAVGCRQLTVSGKHLTLLKGLARLRAPGLTAALSPSVLNGGSRDELCIADARVLPDFNSRYLPMMPDGSVLLVDNVCHQSAEVSTASFYRVESERSRLPSSLGALEEHNFLFRLQLRDKDDGRSCEGLEVPLVAVLRWRPSTAPDTRHISTFYSLPSIRLNRPRLVMTASCPSAVRPRESFPVKYTLTNDLHDFLSVRLRWNSEGELSRPGCEPPFSSSLCAADGRGGHRAPEAAAVCRSPFTDLGRCRKGSSISFTATFQILGTGLFEDITGNLHVLPVPAWHCAFLPQPKNLH